MKKIWALLAASANIVLTGDLIGFFVSDRLTLEGMIIFSIAAIISAMAVVYSIKKYFD